MILSVCNKTLVNNNSYSKESTASTDSQAERELVNSSGVAAFLRLN